MLAEAVHSGSLDFVKHLIQSGYIVQYTAAPRDDNRGELHNSSMLNCREHWFHLSHCSGILCKPTLCSFVWPQMFSE